MASTTKRRPPGKLGAYRAKRDFARTPEPAGRVRRRPPAGTQRFVVQRHRARRLHYDLRLEIGGVLASWAVPKGPTLDPKARRLAVHVEDHPLDYFDFEGVIPEGYGAGDVIVWDWGTWEPADGRKDPERAVADGELHFDLHGEKLGGRFVLVRTKTNADGKESWLLLHKHDEAAEPGWDPEDHPASVKSGRTNDDLRPKKERTAAKKADDGAARPPRPLRFTNVDKILFPARPGEAPVTKGEFVRYYAEIAPTILRYLADRPVNMHRYPDGADRPGFWHKAAPEHAPQWMTRWRNGEADPGETECYFVLDSPEALAWVANFGALELHPWTSTVRDPHAPTWALIDLDPGEKTTWDELLLLARLHRTALEHLGVEARPKVTGRRGLQIWVPVTEGRYTFDDTRAWVEKLSRTIGSLVPELVSWAWQKRDRDGRARLDYTQNAINKTLVAPYSTRPAPGAPVSVPLEWDELDDPGLRPDRWTIRTVFDRLADAGDPLAPLVGMAQELPEL